MDDVFWMDDGLWILDFGWILDYRFSMREYFKNIKFINFFIKFLCAGGVCVTYVRESL